MDLSGEMKVGTHGSEGRWAVIPHGFRLSSAVRLPRSGLTRISLQREVLSTAQLDAYVGAQLEVKEACSQRTLPRPSSEVCQGEDSKTLAMRCWWLASLQKEMASSQAGDEWLLKA